jgi:hypothetical protein
MMRVAACFIEDALREMSALPASKATSAQRASTARIDAVGSGDSPCGISRSHAGCPLQASQQNAVFPCLKKYLIARRCMRANFSNGEPEREFGPK